MFSGALGNPLEQVTVRKVFDELMLGAGVKRIVVHQLRHTFATLSLQHGADISVVSKMMGHGQYKHHL